MTKDVVRNAGLRSDGELVQAVSEKTYSEETADGFAFSEGGSTEVSDHDHDRWIDLLTMNTGATEGDDGHDDWCDLLSMGGGVIEDSATTDDFLF